MKQFDVVLMHPSAPMAVRLPPLALTPKMISDADFLIDGLRAATGIEAVILKRLGGTRGEAGRFEAYTYAMRALSPDLPGGMRWTEEAAEETLRQVRAVRGDQGWADQTWWPAMEAWLKAACERAGEARVEAVSQIRAWDLSAVVEARLVDGTSVYYKEVPRAFAAEPALTAWLARALPPGAPGRVPDVLAHDVARRCVLLKACGGVRLDRAPDLATWERALCDFAAIQRACVSRTEELAALGVPKRPLSGLAAAWDRLLADDGCLRPGTFADLSAAEIAALRASSGAKVRAAVADLAALAVPETLEHGDFHALNAFVTPTGTSVIDWTDAAIAHPFFSLATFLRSLEHAEEFAGRPEVAARLTEAYLASWSGYASRERLLGVLPAVARLGAVFQAVHYRERINPLVDKYGEIHSAVPRYARVSAKLSSRSNGGQHDDHHQNPRRGRWPWSSPDWACAPARPLPPAAAPSRRHQTVAAFPIATVARGVIAGDR